MQKSVEQLINVSPIIDDGQMRLYRLLPTYEIQSLGPFVFVDYYTSNGGRGIGQGAHPHAGIEIISYLLKGHGEQRDSKGFVDQIKSGGPQHIKAGRGILHSETPLEPSRQGLQLWLSLPPDHVFDEPNYVSFDASDIPAVDAGGAVIKVIAGSMLNKVGPIKTVNSSILCHIQIDCNQEFILDLDEGIEELGVLILNGEISISGKTLRNGNLAVLGKGNKIIFESLNGSIPVDIAILGGDKINYPLFFDGPFVMNSQENIRRAYESYRNGDMGEMNEFG